MSEQNMALFVAASKHFVKSAGNASLHYVPDLNSADRFKPLCLAKRKKSFWIWKKPKITPTMLSLNDVLLSPIDVSKLTSSETIIEAYKDTPSFNASGSLGAKIASELDIDLSATDKFSLTVDLGDISKTKVKWEQLETSLSTVKVKQDHELFRELKLTKRTSLCIVLESLACNAKESLDSESDMTEKGKASATIPKVSAISVNVNMQGEVNQKTHHSYTIPAGTIIAFSCTKMDIDENGIIRMHIGVDRVDNIDASEDMPGISKDKFGEQVEEVMKPLLKSKKFPEIKNALMEILQTPECVDSLLELVSTASCIVEDKGSMAFPLEHISKEMGAAKGWRLLLELLGFVISESSSAPSEIKFPSEDPEKLLHSCWALLEAAADLSAQEIAYLIKCSSENGQALLSILLSSLEGNDVPYSKVAKLMETDCSEKQFLNEMKFQVYDGADGKVLSPRWKSQSEARDAFTLIYALLCN